MDASKKQIQKKEMASSFVQRSKEGIGIAERDLLDFITGYLLQIIICCIVGCLPIICRLFAVRDPYLNFSSDSMPFSLNFRVLKEKNVQRTNRPTDGQNLIKRCVNVSSGFVT